MADASRDSASKTSWTGLADRMLACAFLADVEHPHGKASGVLSRAVQSRPSDWHAGQKH